MPRPPKARTRTASRVAAVQALFQTEQANDSAETVIDQFIKHRLGELPGSTGSQGSGGQGSGAQGGGFAVGGFEDGRVPDAEVPLFARVVRGVVLHQEAIDGMLTEALPADWPLNRIDPVLRALLRAGAAELRMADGPPAKVVINEYLDIARGFFTGPEPGMANAVLDRLARLLRPAEF
jgi:N utilization substance protein B